MKALTLARAVEIYLRQRRQLGFALKEDGWMLRSLVDYARSHHHRGLLTADLAVAWAQAPAEASRLWWARRLETVRRLAAFWRAVDPRVEMPPAGLFGPSGRRRCVHLYTASQVSQLLHAAGQLNNDRAATYQTLLGLLASTGIRIGEALRLRRQDVDWVAGTLTICRSKSGRSRCLPLRQCTLEALAGYQHRRPIGAADQFFFHHNGDPLSYGTVAATFRSLRSQLRWTQSPVPRLHDLRHTFAVNCLTDWYAQRANPQQKILALATYLGHRSIVHTYWYLSATPQLLALTQDRWEAQSTRSRGSHAR